MSVLLTIPTISFPSKTGALRMPTLWKSRAQYFSARPVETMTKGFVMISKILTSFGSLPGSTTSLTMSFRVTIPQASSGVLRLTTRLETFLFRIVAMAVVTVSFPSMNTTSLLMTSPTFLNLTFFRLLLDILPPLFLRIASRRLAGEGPQQSLYMKVAEDESRGFATGRSVGHMRWPGLNHIDHRIYWDNPSITDRSINPILLALEQGLTITKSRRPHGLQMIRLASRRLVPRKWLPLGWQGRLHRVVRRQSRYSSRTSLTDLCQD